MKKFFAGFSQNIIVLSLVSFLNDIGGETIKKTIPLFLANVLGVPTAIIGLIEGVADATPQLFQPFSGYFSDLTQQRKPLVVVGQILRSFMLFLFWAGTWPVILLIRFLDRSGKGIANAPRDALVSDSAQQGHVGRAFGLTRMFDNGGAVVGLMLASAILYFQHGAPILTRATFRSIVLLAVVPLILNVGLLAFFVHDIPRKTRAFRFTLHNRLGKRFYVFLALSFLFTLGNSSDAFIILKAQRTGIAVWQIFILLAGYSLVSSLSALPLSSLSDRIGRKTLIVVGWLFYMGVYFFIAQTESSFAMTFLVLVYGLYFGLTEGTARAFVSDIVIPRRLGTAYGIYNMVTGVTLFIASLTAGFLWQTIAPGAAFYFGSAMAFCAAVGMVFLL